MQLEKQMSESVNLEKVYTETSMDLNGDDSKKSRLKTRQPIRQKDKEKQLQRPITEVSEETINESELSSGDEDL